MPGLLTAAIFVSLLGILVCGGLVAQIAQKRDYLLLVVMFVLALPLSAGTYYLVRLPIKGAVDARLAKDSHLNTAARLCYAPLTEEPVKLVPLLVLLVPTFWGRLTRENVVAMALTLGLGFAVGEMWLIFQFIADSPDLAPGGKWANVPAHEFYFFGGYIGERLQTCFTHSGFVVLSVWGLRRGPGWFVLGLAGAMTLHFLGNFPIYLMHIDAFGWGKPVWQQLVGLWVALFTVFSLVLLGGMYFGPAALKKLFTAKVKCPDCGELYSQPIFGMNAGMKRYERCPHCKKWHWIDIRDLLKN
ncbi:MAG: hypothetical protein ACKVP0_14905 [Pirellulaceae bacterium]